MGLAGARGPLLVAALLLALAAGCSARAGGGRLTVLAAASLTESFSEIGQRFEADHPGVTVAFSFGPSDGLAAQINEGAPADVFASASPRWMDAVEEGVGVEYRAEFARNRLVIVTPAANPAGVRSIEDLARPGLRLVLAAEDVPVGTYAREALDKAGVLRRALSNVVSNEEDVKGVVQKVSLGEADAGMVYVTDVTGEVAGDLRVVDIPDPVNVVASYPIAVVASSRRPALAREFVDLVTGPEGQRVLADHGFLPPS
jgi:molybdate transport system substrate-binding protein